MQKDRINSFDVIDALIEQMSALLDLMQSADVSVDIRSMRTSAEMCATMLDEIQVEVEKLEKEDKTAPEDKDKVRVMMKTLPESCRDCRSYDYLSGRCVCATSIYFTHNDPKPCDKYEEVKYESQS